MVSYDGTAYAGWQTQPDVATVQGVLSRAAGALLGAGTRVTGASRTDAGVHALRQVVSIVAESALPVAAVPGALNAALPRDIRVVEAADAGPGFHARRSAVWKRYAYLIDNAPIPNPLLLRYAWHVARPLDVHAMRRAARILHGRHDFSAFCAAPGRGTSPVCVVRALHVLRRRQRVTVLVSADRFLHHMVRNIVGSLVAVGRGAREPSWLSAVLAARERAGAGVTAPARGLTLVRVLF